MVPESTLEELETACIAATHCLTRLAIVTTKIEIQPGDVEPALLAEAISEPARELLESWRALYVALNPHVQRDFMAACKEPVEIGEVVVAESVHSAALWVSHQALVGLSIVLMPAGYWPSSEDPETDCFLGDLRSEPPVDVSEIAVRALRAVFDQWSLKELRRYIMLVHFECAAVRVQLPPAGKGEDGEPRNLNESSLKPIQDQEVKDLLGKKVATPPTPYQTLWDYAQKMWTTGTDKFKICKHISEGPGNYSECLEDLVPNTSKRTDQTKRFHSVCGPMNKEIRAAMGLEVYRFGEQIFVCEAGRKPLEHKPKPKKTTPKKTTLKKSTTKRKR